jgi:ribose 5-phosphate isomerase
VATASDRVVVIADRGKRVEALGAFPLPVEVIPFGWRATQALIEELLLGLDVQGRETALRMKDGEPFVTDEGNRILDLCGSGASATRAAFAGAEPDSPGSWRTASSSTCATR